MGYKGKGEVFHLYNIYKQFNMLSTLKNKIFTVVAFNLYTILTFGIQSLKGFRIY